MRVLRWRCRPFQSGFAFTRVQYQHSLASLVEQGKFDEATQEHARLRQLGQTIAFDSTFEEAATRILHSESKSATSFSQCLTFLPPASYPDDVPAPTLVRLLLRSPTQYMPFILELAPIASEKGYTHLYKNLLLPCIQKHASQHQYEHLINVVSGLAQHHFVLRLALTFYKARLSISMQILWMTMRYTKPLRGIFPKLLRPAV
jgi:hypothetical protein